MMELTNKNRPYKPDGIGVFSYKVLLWFFLGLLIGLFTALMQGFLSIWFLFAFIPGAIIVGAGFGLVFIWYMDRSAARHAADPVADGRRAVPARIDSVNFAGVRLMEKRELMAITCTVFPRYGEPYQTTVRQFMTVEAQDRLNLLADRAMVTFYEDPRNPGYGTVVPEVATNEVVDDKQDSIGRKVYPERQDAGFLQLFGRNPNLLTRGASMVLIFAIFAVGFLLPYRMTGNMDWLRVRVLNWPQKLIFQYKGNFNPEAFEMAFDKAEEYIGDRRVESLLFYKNFTTVRAEDPGKPGYVGHTTIRGNTLQEGILSLTTADTDRLFTMDSVDYELFKKALDDVATDHDIDDIMYIGARKGIRWGTRDGCIPPDYDRYHIDIHVVFEGGDESLDYHGETGERLPE